LRRRSGGRQSGSGASRLGRHAPDWLLEAGLNRDGPPVQLHTGECWNVGKRHPGVTREEGLRALADGVKACGACRPETELGVLD
jgi:hypothetical protein